MFRIFLSLVCLFLTACGKAQELSKTPTATSPADLPVVAATDLLPVLDIPNMATPAPSPFPVKTLSRDWHSTLNPILDQGGQWHVLVRAPDGGVIYERGSQDVIHPASVIKLAIGMLVVSWLEDEYGSFEKALSHGPLNAGRSYEQLLKAMLVFSEEEATDLLQNALVEGYGWKKIDQHLVDWGAPHTSLVPRRSSAADTVNLLVDLNERKLPSRAASRIILGFLSEVTQGDKVRIWKVKDILPAGAIIYDKRGSLTDPVIVADAAIIVLPDGSPYYLCLYGYPDNTTNFDDLDRMIGEFAIAWYRELSRAQ